MYQYALVQGSGRNVTVRLFRYYANAERVAGREGGVIAIAEQGEAKS